MKKIEKNELREFVKAQLKKMREGSTTANIAVYSTPKAFVGDETADEPTSFNVEDEQYAYSIKAPKERKNSIKLHELSYKGFKEDSTRSNTQKINLNILEVAKNLGSLSRMLDHSIKLKTEQKLNSNIHWKRTNEALSKIHNRITQIAEKANSLYNLNEATANTVKTKLVDYFNKVGITIRPEDLEYNQAGTDHFEFDVMLLGEPQAIDYNRGMLIYQGYDKEQPLGNLDQESEVIANLTKIFKP